ncbi:hypothetical protein VFC49_08275 [Thermococcus sp. SY098]|uniref:hypothetical protein n=1 Tax=Thermococcus sp. SY098 TaxID=3111325 RepID=UPI002D775C73|nr:hypothetical protein [Thermococcus sp. SY098]WRS52052.1 hypothetical protein VFC49_08275 [Thermococcus sp. SY098]
MINYPFLLLIFLFISILYGLIFHYGFWKGVYFALTLQMILFIVVNILSRSTSRSPGITASILIIIFSGLLAGIWMNISNTQSSTQQQNYNLTTRKNISFIGTVALLGFLSAYIIFIETNNVFLSVTIFLSLIQVVARIIIKLNTAVMALASIFLLLGFLTTLQPTSTLEELSLIVFVIFYLTALILTYLSK